MKPVTCVEWGMYGCDTGCDGYRVYVQKEPDGDLEEVGFCFATWWHDEDKEKFVRDCAEGCGYPDVEVDLERCEFVSGGV